MLLVVNEKQKTMTRLMWERLGYRQSLITNCGIDAIVTTRTGELTRPTVKLSPVLAPLGAEDFLAGTEARKES